MYTLLCLIVVGTHVSIPGLESMLNDSLSSSVKEIISKGLIYAAIRSKSETVIFGKIPVYIIV